MQKKFLSLPEWQQTALVGMVVWLLFAAGTGVYALVNGNILAALGWPSTQSEKLAAAPSPVPTRPPVIAETPSPEPSASPNSTPTPTPKASSSPTPKPTTSPSPSTTGKTYVLNWSEGSVTTKVHQANEGYAVYALLKYDGATVTDQSKVKYTWTVTDNSIADITPFTGCIDGIKEPCPEDHATIKAKKEGSTTVIAKASWKDTGAFIDDVTIALTVSGSNSSASPSPSPVSSGPPEMQISFPSSGQTVAKTDSGTICVADVPVQNTQGLQRKENINGAGWTGYQNHTTLCYSPVVGANTLQLQYKNSSNLESVVYSISFSYGP